MMKPDIRQGTHPHIVAEPHSPEHGGLTRGADYCAALGMEEFIGAVLTGLHAGKRDDRRRSSRN